MKTLTYSITINAGKKHVWETMIDPETYKLWVKPFSPDSQFEGDWTEGSYMLFIDPPHGGTKCLLEKVQPYDKMVGKHIALITKDGTEDSESDVAKEWYGTTETYSYVEENGKTTLTVEMQTHEKFAPMFEDCWPKALELVKGLCEK
ncbi:MAG: SRPBCC domain-containing protein [Calditrichaeota bacterium]|nr:MAG: SRPBCC domain-containing protein [Calditrichota bacterium]